MDPFPSFSCVHAKNVVVLLLLPPLRYTTLCCLFLLLMERTKMATKAPDDGGEIDCTWGWRHGWRWDWLWLEKSVATMGPVAPPSINVRHLAEENVREDLIRNGSRSYCWWQRRRRWTINYCSQWTMTNNKQCNRFGVTWTLTEKEKRFHGGER